MATITETTPPKGKKPKREPKVRAPREPKAPKPAKQPRPPKAEKPAKEPKAAAAPKPVWPDPAKPSLVFLPTRNLGARARRQATRRALLVSLGVLGATAAGYLFVLAGTAGAQAQVDKEAAITAKEQAFLTQNRTLQQYFDGFVERKAAASSALQQDVDYSKVLRTVSGANGVGATFTGISVVTDPTRCSASNPFAASAAIGCLEIDGEVPSLADVGRFSAALAQNKQMLTDPYVSESSVNDHSTAFKLTVGFTSQALSAKGGAFAPTDEELKASSGPAGAQQGSAQPSTTSQGASK